MELYSLTAHELRELVLKGEASCIDIAKSVFDRIDKTEGSVDAYLEITRDIALKQAEEADKIFKELGNNAPELCGIPIAIKDNMCTEGIKTTCASKILYNFIPPYDATVVKKLKNQHAVLIGKTNLDEFAMGSSTETSYFKKTKNPYDLTHVPGGSSGGSAAAVASDEAILALGSDTGGSIRQPASFCGIVGMKPTYGLVSRFGLVAYASSLDQIGPFAKDCTDCAALLNVITGKDRMDSTSLDIEYPDYKKGLVNDVKGMKIGIPKEYLGSGVADDVKNAILSSAKKFKELGAVVSECSLPLTKYALPSYYLIACAEASSNLARFDGIKYGYRSEKFNSLNELYENTRSEGFGSEVIRRIMLGTYVLSAGFYDAYYKKAQKVRTLIRQDFDRIFSDFDLIITPASPVTAWKFGEMSKDPLQMYAADICTVSVNIAGLPGMVIPCGTDSSNLPIGLQLIGNSFSELTLLRAGYTFEQNTSFHSMRPSL
jgi:aspartyl-tRNA(Asn)/glutamyl-tRNA(Gln) amidotransferase subunit A